MAREAPTVEEQLREALEHHRDVLQIVMENTGAMLVYLDRESRFVHANAAYIQGCGHTWDELQGRYHFDFFPNAENEAIFNRVRDSGEPVEFKAKPFEYADQPERGVTYWDWTLTPVKDGAGQVEGLVLSLLDVTEHQRLLADLRDANERLAAQNDELQAKREELQSQAAAMQAQNEALRVACEALRRSEEQARQQLAEIETIYNSAPIGLCVFDRDLR